MKPGKPLARTPMSASTRPLLRSVPLRRTAMTRRITLQLAASRDLLAMSRAMVRLRSGDVCELCGAGQAAQVHHRKARQEGGSSRDPAIHSVANLLHVCLWCHDMAERHPDRWAFGWKVHRAHDPAATAVLLVLGDWTTEPAWLLLDDEGGRCPAPDRGGDAA